MLIIINPTMPQNYRNSLLANFTIIFPKFEEIDSQAEGFRSLFASIHFTWYNRYSTKVSFFFPKIKSHSYLQFILSEDMDEDEAIHIDPTTYRRIGKKKVNSSTFIPRASKEMQGNADFCSLMEETLEDVLIWQSIEVRLFSYYSHL